MSKVKPLDYTKDRESLKTFLEEFNFYDDDGNKIFRYREQLTKIAHREKVDLVIDLADVEEHDAALADSIRNNAKRYMNLIAQLIEEILPNFKERAVPAKDCLDVFIEHRLLTQQRNQLPGDQSANVTKFAPELLRRYEICFKDSTVENSEKEQQDKTFSVRSLLAERIGKIVTVKGIITKNTEVKPLLCVATYTCDRCGRESSQKVTSLSYMPLNSCESDDCKATKSGGRLFFQAKGSKFVKFQELKLQEHSDQVPVGHIPRSITVYCRGEVTRQCQSGDHVILTGILFPRSQEGYRSMQGGAFETFIEAHRIKNLGNSDDSGSDGSNELTDEEVQILKEPEIYHKLAKSIAPEIYGMDDVKKALLLLLVGGTDKSTGDLKIRGNINICLMGDPGVAKSQLLSFICRLSPRSQFTTGRGSSGVGLTAAVVKDNLTGQMMLEGGALVLADQGICCIDEFDKMAEGDRTAIHEVMEQQTISIAKAGIMTRLNARVSILAAANPAYGRYNLKRSIEQNVNLPAALLSRFDLLWLLQDRADRTTDAKLAAHILRVHRNCEEPVKKDDFIDMDLLKRYIRVCKKRQPVIPETLRDVIVDTYVEMRNKHRPVDGQKNDNKVFTSPRNLLAVLRLATALAKLRLVDEVDREDIEEANRLIEASKSSINQPEEQTNRGTTATRLLQLIKDIAGNRTSVRVADIMERAQSRGFNPAQVNEIIQKYEDANVWILNQAKTALTFID